MHPVSTHTKGRNLVFAIRKRTKNIFLSGVEFVRRSPRKWGLAFRLPPYDIPCSVPVNGLKFHVEHLHVAGVCEPRILAHEIP